MKPIYEFLPASRRIGTPEEEALLDQAMNETLAKLGATPLPTQKKKGNLPTKEEIEDALKGL